MRYRKAKRAIWGVALISCGILVWNLPMGNRETGNFVLQSLNHAEVRAPVAGFVTRVYYGEGEKVSEGIVIADMEVPELNSEIARKRSEIAEAHAILKSLGADIPLTMRTTLAALLVGGEGERNKGKENTSTVGSVGNAEAKGKVHEIEAELGYARQRYKQAQILNRTNAVSDDQLWEMKKDYEVWLHKHQQVLSEQEAENAKLARLIEELRYLEDMSGKLALRSPIGGIVTTPRLMELKGRYYEEGELIFEVVDPSELEAQVTIGEQNMAAIAPGQAVVLKPFSLPYRTFKGHVVRIAPVIHQPNKATPSASSQRRSGELMIYCKLDEASEALAPGMSGYARIQLAKDTFGNIVARRFMRFIRTEFWW
jgi:multidrug resistance efflux pump